MIRYLPYVARSAWRNRVRTLLTVLGVGVAVFMVAGLGAFLISRDRALEAASESILVVSQKDVY
ncbi:MAG: hypothetical protein ACYS99_23590 [Planctomycetota bacterium]|jgi:hypothetical protein